MEDVNRAIGSWRWQRPSLPQSICEAAHGGQSAIQRFWLVAFTKNDQAHRSTLLLALSNRSDATGGWSTFALNATLNGNDDSGFWCDYEKLGFDTQAIYLTCNMYTFASKPEFQYAKIKVLTKGQFLSGDGGLKWWDFWDLREGGFLDREKSSTIQPARMYGASDADGDYLIDAASPPSPLATLHPDPLGLALPQFSPLAAERPGRRPADRRRRQADRRAGRGRLRGGRLRAGRVRRSSPAAHPRGGGEALGADRGAALRGSTAEVHRGGSPADRAQRRAVVEASPGAGIAEPIRDDLRPLPCTS